MDSLSAAPQKLDVWEDVTPEEIALADTIRRVQGLSPEPFKDMISGMYMDITPSVRYKTFGELYTYCYRYGMLPEYACG